MCTYFHHRIHIYNFFQQFHTLPQRVIIRSNTVTFKTLCEQYFDETITFSIRHECSLMPMTIVKRLKELAVYVNQPIGWDPI